MQWNCFDKTTEYSLIEVKGGSPLKTKEPSTVDCIQYFYYTASIKLCEIGDLIAYNPLRHSFTAFSSDR